MRGDVGPAVQPRVLGAAVGGDQRGAAAHVLAVVEPEVAGHAGQQHAVGLAQRLAALVAHLQRVVAARAGRAPCPTGTPGCRALARPRPARRPRRRAPPPGCRSPSAAARPWPARRARPAAALSAARGSVHCARRCGVVSWLPANMRCAWRFRYQRSARSGKRSALAARRRRTTGGCEASSYSRSTGHSMNTGPGTPDCASAKASSTAGPRSRTRLILKKRLTCGATSGRWSMSCSAPRPCSAVGAAPPISITGDCASCAFFSAVMVLVMPGPAVTAATPGTARQPRRGVGGEHRGGLVAHVDDADAARLGRAQDRRDVAAAQREQAGHAVGLQRLGDAVAAVAYGCCSVMPTPPWLPLAYQASTCGADRGLDAGALDLHRRRQAAVLDRPGLAGDDDHAQLLVVGQAVVHAAAAARSSSPLHVGAHGRHRAGAGAVSRPAPPSHRPPAGPRPTPGTARPSGAR